ncbi:MAG: glycosyltransferase family 4 protein [archaeon]
MTRKINLLFVSTYPPKECGIATFTKDLTSAINKKHDGGVRTQILALNEGGEDYDYPSEVKYRMGSYDYDDWIRVADEINKDDSIDAISIQHEFGIFGGEKSCHPLPFLDRVKKPVVMTFHSVFPNPEHEVRALVDSMAKRASAFVVMTQKAVEIFRKYYEVNIPIHVIPHGIPEVDFEEQEKYKQELDVSGRRIISSFGLVGPGKGYEYVIESLPKVVEKFPDLLYLIVGETHPGVKEHQGEAYRNKLKRKIKDLGIERNVGFVNRYLELDEVVEHLKATDLYVASNQNPEQITSGTLVYAMGCGRAIVSTPFPHAVDVIKEGNGLIVDFDKIEEFSDAITILLSDPARLKEIEKNNYEYTRQMTWSNVAKSYGDVFRDLIGA